MSSKFSNRQLLRFAAGSPATRPAINKATKAAARAYPAIDSVLRGAVMRVKKLGPASSRELALRLYVLLDEHGHFEKKESYEEQSNNN